MDFLGIGPLELIVVLIITFIVVGPERLPEFARSVGKTLRDVRAMSQGLTTEWQRELNSVTQLEPGESLQETLTKPFTDVQTEVKQAVTEPLGTDEDLQEVLTKPFKDVQTEVKQAVTEPLGTDEDLQEVLTKPFKDAQADLEEALDAPPTSSSDSEPEPAPPETQSAEQSDSQSDDIDHAET
jgi:sec-independent protein translocase protein TatB